MDIPKRHSGPRGVMFKRYLLGGYLFVEEILSTEPFKNLSVTQDEILELVKSNDKQRFSVRYTHLF